MEQISSDEHLGSLAEAVLEALKGHKEAGEKVKAVRTRREDENGDGHENETVEGDRIEDK
jgi:hypothetical protein